MIYRKFSKRQLLAMTWWNRPRLKNFDGIICDGAVRSGKTVCMTVGFFLWSMGNFQNQTFGICGKTIGSLRRNLIRNLPKWLGGLLEIREVRSENKLVVRAGDRENVYFLFGGEDDSAYQLIQGITLAGVLLDEAALMSRSFLEQACARCSVEGAKLWFNCNPEGPEHWFYKDWILQKDRKKLLRLHFTMDDNPGLEPSVRQRYERLYDGLFYRRFVLGQWCVAQGLVYDFRPEYVVRDVPTEGSWYISVDYGTMNPFSAGLWCVVGSTAVRVKEFYYEGRAAGHLMTDEDYYEALENLAGDRVIEKVVVDPSAASFIATIRAHGRFSVRKARNDVMPGIRLVTAMLRNGTVRIGADCEAAIREFGLYRWDAGQDRPVKEFDHAMDEIRYFCATVMRRMGNG